MTFTKRYRYRFGDIDEAGIGYYPALLHYFHCAFEDWWWEALGTPYSEVLHEHDLGLPAVHLECDFFAPVRYGDEPDVHLGVLRIGESSVELGFWMTVGDDPRPRCRARVVTAAVHVREMSRRRLPDAWRERFSAFTLREEDFPTA